MEIDTVEPEVRVRGLLTIITMAGMLAYLTGCGGIAYQTTPWQKGSFLMVCDKPGCDSAAAALIGMQKAKTESPDTLGAFYTNRAMEEDSEIRRTSAFKPGLFSLPTMGGDK